MIAFDIKDGKVVVKATDLLVKEFRELWNFDKTKDKRRATDNLSFVYLYCDLNSPLSDIDYTERHAIAQRNAYGVPDPGFTKEEAELIDEAVDAYLANNENAERRMVAVINDKIDDIRREIQAHQVQIVKNTNVNTGVVSFVTNIPIITKALTELDSLLAVKERIEARLAKTGTGDGVVRGGKKPSILEQGKFSAAKLQKK